MTTLFGWRWSLASAGFTDSKPGSITSSDNRSERWSGAKPTMFRVDAMNPPSGWSANRNRGIRSPSIAFEYPYHDHHRLDLRWYSGTSVPNTVLRGHTSQSAASGQPDSSRH